MVTIVGVECFTACFGILASESLTVFKAQKRAIKAQESGEFNRSTPELVVDEVSVDELVVCVALHLSLTPVRRQQCSWIFVVGSLLLTSANTILIFCYAVTLRDKYWMTANVSNPIAIMSFIMTVCMKPKFGGMNYKYFLYFHFISFLVASEVFLGVGDFRQGLAVKSFINLVRIMIECALFKQLLKLRDAVAQVSLGCHFISSP
jgi:hypothetical protein